MGMAVPPTHPLLRGYEHDSRGRKISCMMESQEGKTMEHSIIALTACVTLGLSVSMALEFARRQFTKKRNLYRMNQALRRGLSRQGEPWSPSPRVVEWQTCEPSSANW